MSQYKNNQTNVPPVADIEAQIKDIQERKKQAQAEDERDKGIGLLESGYFDSDLYDANGTQKGKYENYVTSIAPNEDEDEDDDEPIRPADKRTTGFGAPMAFINDIARVSSTLLRNCATKNLSIFFRRASPITTRSRAAGPRPWARRKMSTGRSDGSKFCRPHASIHSLTVSLAASSCLSLVVKVLSRKSFPFV